MIQQNEEVKNKIYDTFLLEEAIKNFPHTYKTLLTDGCCNDNTLQFILRRKLGNLHQEGHIFKCVIPGTRRGEIIFYHPDKKYNILIEADRIGVIIYCFFDFVKDSKYYLRMKGYWVLNKCRWIKKDEEKIIFLGNCLKLI